MIVHRKETRDTKLPRIVGFYRFFRLVFITILVSLSSAFGVTLTYDLAGGHLSDGTTSSYTYDSSLGNGGVLDNPIRDGYIFTGWCTSSQISDNTCTPNLSQESGKQFVRWTAPNNLNENTTYIAQWTPSKFEITTTELNDKNDISQDFGMYIGSAGHFWVDWGDGTVYYILTLTMIRVLTR